MAPRAEPAPIFLGQVLGLLPTVAPHTVTDPILSRQLRRLFPRLFPEWEEPDEDARAPVRTYTLITDGKGGGELLIGGESVGVVLLPLDLSTSPAAAVFRITGIAGRALTVSGVLEGDG